MLIQALCSKASVFSFRHKIIAVNGLFSLMTHRKNFIPVLLPVVLRYEVRVAALADVDFQQRAALRDRQQHAPSAETPLRSPRSAC